MNHKVMACIDGAEVTKEVCDYAAWASLRLDAPLEFLHVLEKETYPEQQNYSGSIGLGSRESLLKELAELDEKRGKLALQQGKLMLEDARQRAIAGGVAEPTARQRHGGLVESLIELEQDIRLLVMGKHDQNLSEHIGSRLENVVRALHCPILIASNQFKRPERVMFAYDGSNTTHKGIDRLAGSPIFQGLSCHVVMVGSDTKANRGQLEWARHTLEANAHSVTTALISGSVERALCDYRAAQDIDLLVMGAYGHSVIRRFLVGSVTTSVIRNASAPILLLR